MNPNRIIIKYCCRGAYKGFKEKYGKVITPYFNTWLECSFYQDAYRVFSESLGNGLVLQEEFCM